jgi:hypothetical protein
MAMPNRRLPKHPSGPNRILIAALGLAGGLLLGALTAVVARPPPLRLQPEVHRNRRDHFYRLAVQ